jgi:hypothetical protein
MISDRIADLEGRLDRDNRLIERSRSSKGPEWLEDIADSRRMTTRHLGHAYALWNQYCAL